MTKLLSYLAISAFIFVAPVFTRTKAVCAQSQLPYIFGEPTLLPEPLNLPAAWNSSANISTDGLELYLTSNRAPGWGTYVARRTDVSVPFGTPTRVGGSDLNHGVISHDGLSLFVNDDTRGGSGSQDIFVMSRTEIGGSFGPPQNLGPIVNGDQADRWASISADGLELYFTRNPSAADLLGGEIFVAKRDNVSAEFAEVTRLPSAINTGSTMAPSISPDGLTLFFSSDRPGGFGDLDIWAATRPSKDVEWGDAVNLGQNVNGPLADWKPSLSSDETTLYFTRFSLVDDGRIWAAAVSIVPEPSAAFLFGVALLCVPTLVRRNATVAGV